MPSEERRAYYKQYAKENADKIASYRENRKEEYADYQRKWRKSPKGILSYKQWLAEYWPKWYAAHTEERRVYMLGWRGRNRDKVKKYNAAYRRRRAVSQSEKEKNKLVEEHERQKNRRTKK